MFKYMVVLALVAVATAAPQFLVRSAVIDNEGAKQVGLPYANGWTDGPNNGVGPIVHAYAAPALVHSPVVHSSVVHAAPLVHGAHQFVF